MGLFDQLSSVLQQYSGNTASGQPPADVNQHFDQVAQAAPPSVLAEGLSAAFHSNSTPAFGEMLTSLFNQSSGEQKAGIVEPVAGFRRTRRAVPTHRWWWWRGPGILARFG